MNRIAAAIALLALAATLGLPMVFFFDQMSLEQAKTGLLIAAVAWFLAVPFWLKGKGKL